MQKESNNIKRWDLDSIIDAEQYFQISHQALLWRLRHFLNEITYEQYMGANLAYLKIMVGEGIVTLEHVLDIALGYIYK